MHAAVRRRALPVAICGIICALIGLSLTLFSPVTPFTPPNFVGMNLQFCAMLIGAGIFFYAKPTPGTQTALACSLAAVLLGMGGTIFYTMQTVKLRTLKEQRELETVTLLATTAKEYAKTHDGKYPADLLVFLESGLIQPEQLRSPFTMNPKSVLFTDYKGGTGKITSRDELRALVEESSDYLYVGGDLRLAPPGLEKELLVAFSSGAIMRVSWAIATADGHAEFINVEETHRVMQANNDARAKMELGALRPPKFIEEAWKEAASQPGR